MAISRKLLAPVSHQWFSDAGKPLVGGSIYVYKAGTLELATVYANAEGGALSNPVSLNAAGRVANGSIYFDSGIVYDVQVKLGTTTIESLSSIVGLPSQETSLVGAKITDEFTGTGVKTQFTLSADPVDINNIQVVIDGLILRKTVDYSLTDTTLTFVVAPSLNAQIVVTQNRAFASEVPASALRNKIVDTFTTVNNQFAYNLTTDPKSVNNLTVSLDGFVLTPNIDYTLVGVVLTLANNPGVKELVVQYNDILPIQSDSSDVITYSTTGQYLTNYLDTLPTTLSYVRPGSNTTITTVFNALKNANANAMTDYNAVGNGISIDETSFANAILDKASSTTTFEIPVGTYPITAQKSLTGYFKISGYGDESRVKLGTSSQSGFAYTAQTGVFDDHPHNQLTDFRITGDGVMTAYPGAQNGTTTGINYAVTANIGNLHKIDGVCVELHNIGRHVKSSYVNQGQWNHYRANKIGLKLEEVTSFTEFGSYWRYNSTAAIDIVGGQNIIIQGGAVEGNPGVGLRYTNGGSTWGQLQIRDTYFESNGSETGGIWSIDVPPGSPLMTTVIGGSMWRNIASGVTSGPYRLGDNVTIDGTTLNGSFYAKYVRLRNTRGTPSWGTFATESTARLFGLIEPPVMLEYSPAQQEYDFTGATGGQCFATIMRNRGSAKIPGVTNVMSATYPYGISASSGATSSANAALNFGDGDFVKVAYAATVGNFNSNYATIVNFTDTTKQYRVACVIVYPEADCEIGVVQSVGGQSINVNYALKANTYYRLVFNGMAPMTAGSFLRIFPLNSAAPVINYLGVWASQHATHVQQLQICKMLVDGVL